MQRIEYIDLAKGICITLIILIHCHVNVNIPGMSMMRIPLYYILSGIFFKDYGGIIPTIVTKINKLFIPFLFFYLISYLLFYLIQEWNPDLLKTPATGIADVFTQKQYFNGPIWFILCLFEVNLVFAFLSIVLKLKGLTLGVVCAIIGCVGIYLGTEKIFLPCVIDSTFTTLPMFYMGYLLKQATILKKPSIWYHDLTTALVFYLVSLIITWIFNPNLGCLRNWPHGNPLAIYALAFTNVLTLLFLCKVVGKVPFISYIGRYSIVMLCIHHLVYRPLLLFFQPYIVALLTLIICTLLIKPLTIYIPWFTAQRPLIKLPSTHLS